MGRTGREWIFRGSAVRAAQVACATALFCLALAPSSLAAPTHPHLSALDLTGLNHACGAAVDSHGDVYASSAGESKVKVFNAAHTLLKEISNAHEPCGLAVDTSGNLYVSEKATGHVVRYHPSEYPPTASATYTETTIDASGSAKGISVDPADNSLYVAEGSRVQMYNSEGEPGVNEQQRVRAPSSGKYKLCFQVQCTIELEWNASHEEVKAALQALLTIGTGNVSVIQSPTEPANIRDHLVIFKGALGGTNVEQLTCISGCFIATFNNGNPGHIGEGELSGATGVASYTYGATTSNERRYISVAEPGSGKIEVLVGRFGNSPAGFEPGTVEERATIDGSETPDGELGLGSGAYLSVDPKTGHLFSYDATHNVLNEFEAGGRYFTQIANPALEDAASTQVALDRSGGAHDGTLYVSAGAGAGAKLAAFGPLVEPSRSALPSLSRDFAGICGAAVDSQGDLYLAGATTIKIYSPSGAELGSITDNQHPCQLAVDSEGNLYAVELGSILTPGDEKVVLYEPSAYPFAGAPVYAAPKKIEETPFPEGIAVDPANDRLFVTHLEVAAIEYKSAQEGSGVLDAEFCGIGSHAAGIGVFGHNGDVYVVDESAHAIDVCNGDGTKVLNRIDGSGSPGGAFGELSGIQIAVDQSDGHVLVGMMRIRGAVEEYEPSGAFVGRYGSFTEHAGNISPIAIDNSGGPDDGNLYVAYTDPAPGAFDLTAFGPLNYGEAPLPATGAAGEVGPTGAVLRGTLNPRGFDLEECAFEWGLAGHPYEHKALCAETPAQIGHGKAPVAVHLAVTGLEPQTTRYRFRLLAKNKFGEGEGEEAIFGPPISTTKTAQPILYREATLHGEVDPSGLATSYRFEYLTQAEYEEGGESFEGAQSTPAGSLPASGGGPTEVKAPLTGLQEGTAYRFLLLAENEAAGAEGLERSFETLQRPGPASCPNQTLRLEDDSGNLPDCRAYELVTPPDTRGAVPRGEEASDAFNNWLTTPSGPLAGESLAFFVREASLPGTEGNGLRDAFHATRGPAGWASALFGPSYAQIGEGSSNALDRGTAADQLYALWQFIGSGKPATAFPPGRYLSTPEDAPAPSPTCAVAGHAGERFEWTGCGALGFDPLAVGRYVSAGGRTIFSSKAKLEEGAASAGTESIYERTPGGPTEVVSLLPGDLTPGAGATFLGATEDAGAVVFSVAGKLYLRREGETVKVSDGPASFAGISENGERVFYTDNASSSQAAGLFAFDAEGAVTTQIAADAVFVNVSAEGSHAYFSSEDEIGGEGTSGAHNLYAWDGGTTEFVATLATDDLGLGASFPGTGNVGVALDSWAGRCFRPSNSLSEGRGVCPSRTTPDGRFLVFQSHADLTSPYEGNGHSEIYRYDSQDESLLCVSCDPSGVPASAEADLQSLVFSKSGTLGTTLIPNVTEDGSEVFFQTTAQLLPEDANSVLDVYEWRAQGVGGCTRAAGCLALISSGQSASPSYLYSMTPDGHDVFFSTLEKLVDADIPGSASIYDARVDGGFPVEVEAEPCHGDACQGEGSAPPELPAIGTQAAGAGNVEEAPLSPVPCGKGKRRVKGRCVAVHKHHRKKRAKRKRRSGR